MIILNLTINERLNHPDLLEQGRMNVAEFTEELLRVGDSNLNTSTLGLKKRRPYRPIITSMRILRTLSSIKFTLACG